MENGCHGNHNANLQWPNIQISSEYIKMYVHQIWCFYHKMNNCYEMMSYNAALISSLEHGLHILIYFLLLYICNDMLKCLSLQALSERPVGCFPMMKSVAY